VLSRVALEGIDGSAVAALAKRIRDAAPALGYGAIALVDSPRWPIDLDWSHREPMPRLSIPTGRTIDRTLRELIRRLRGAGAARAVDRCSMFPTPPMAYFARCVSSADGKPHLRAIGLSLFASLAGCRAARRPLGRGALFTRFMLVGFATYRALETAGVATFESYPDLQFRLWSDGSRLPPKAQRSRALVVRRRINARLASKLGVTIEPAATLDQADAAMLALGAALAAREGALVVVEDPCEGSFMVALGEREAGCIESDAGHEQATLS
jgi:hypothetical protein